MELTSRPYSGDDDLRALKEFVVTTTDAARTNFYHVGDLLWGMYQNTVFDPGQNIRLWWSEHGRLVGFAWFHIGRTSRSVNWVSHPALPDRRLLDEQALAWAWEREAESATEGQERLLVTTALEDDADRIAFLERHGFTRSPDHMLHLRRDLRVPIPPAELPQGVVVHPVAGVEEYEERVSIHLEVWHPSKVTLEAYRRLRGVSGYDPELDLVAVTPEGVFASYCICWLDPVNRIGEFEPVGTRLAYRGKGLGKAVMWEGLRRLKARGMETAIVLTNSPNAAAISLYQSVGFEVENREYDWMQRR